MKISKRALQTYLLFLIFFTLTCPTKTYIRPAGHTIICNQTNDLIYLYFNEYFLDSLKPQDSVRYYFKVGFAWYLGIERKDNKKNTYDWAALTNIKFIPEDGMGTNTPLFFKGVVNDSVKYTYDLQPLHMNKTTPDSLIIFRNMENEN